MNAITLLETKMLSGFFFLFFCPGAMILGLAGLGVSGQGGRLNAALSLWLDASSIDKRPSAGGGGRNSSGGLQES